MKKNELKDITEITPEYDVAISFLSSDQLLAAELAGRLQESLKVFFFPKAQTQLEPGRHRRPGRRSLGTERAARSGCSGGRTPGYATAPR